VLTGGGSRPSPPTPGSALAQLEARHRAHARVEDRIRCAKSTGLARLPSRQFAINTVWVELALTAADLLAWTQTTLPEGELYTTLEVKVNLVRAITKETGLVRATGRLIHRGRTTATAEGDIRDTKGNLLAHGTTTCVIFPAKK
jgi:uncharacterized protein (TIGR00369 family)